MGSFNRFFYYIFENEKINKNSLQYKDTRQR